ncbi:MAG: HlyD family efflux transporter periplasmic adaptor subunit [Pseudomonadota bacterium]
MRFLRQSMIGLFLSSVALGLLVLAAWQVRSAVQQRLADEPFAPPARERVFAVNVAVATPSDVAPVLETFGELKSRRLLELRAPQGGRVISLAQGFEDGGEVSVGEVLIRLDPADMQSALDRASTDVADAEAEERDAARSLALARDEFAAAEDQAVLRDQALARQRDLQDRGVGTATAVETAELAASSARQAVLTRAQAIAQAEARVDQSATRLSRARIALAEAQRRLDDRTLAAPFDGTLTGTNVVVGRLVSANERLAELIDPTDLEVSFRVSTAQYARLLDSTGDLLGAQVRVTLDVAGVDLDVQGKITRAAAAAGEGATGRLIFASLENAAGFKPGDFVTVRVSEPVLERVVRLPASAVGADGAVLVVAEGNRLERVAVEVLRNQGDDVLVRGDIIGREVVQARSPLLGAGIAVNPIRPQTDEASAPQVPHMLELTEERRARLVAFVEGNQRMPQEAKERVLARLSQPMVPLQMVERIEARMGG